MDFIFGLVGLGDREKRRVVLGRGEGGRGGGGYSSRKGTRIILMLLKSCGPDLRSLTVRGFGDRPAKTAPVLGAWPFDAPFWIHPGPGPGLGRKINDLPWCSQRGAHESLVFGPSNSHFSPSGIKYFKTERREKNNAIGFV